MRTGPITQRSAALPLSCIPNGKVSWIYYPPFGDTLARLMYNCKTTGPVRDSNPRPLAPKARIIPLDQQAVSD